MKTFKMPKKIIITWDFDGPIGQINATYPYNFRYEDFELEMPMAEYALEKLAEYNLKTCFAITGFSAEKGVLPFNFPDFIAKIQEAGHEIASHNWKHEWVPLFKEDQIEKSFKRSKSALENAINGKQEVVGFVPPHNKPATWVRRGAYSLEDRGLWPFFEMGDLENVYLTLKKSGYKWMRIAHNPIKYKFGLGSRSKTGKVYAHNGLLILENHYTGFDKFVRDIIEESSEEYFIISAHPAMLAKEEKKKESKIHFEEFLKTFGNNPDYQFVRPMDLLKDFGIQ